MKQTDDFVDVSPTLEAVVCGVCLVVIAFFAGVIFAPWVAL